jgi:hypothetical protein
VRGTGRDVGGRGGLPRGREKGRGDCCRGAAGAAS